MECVINRTSCKASKCQKKENYFRCLATPTVVFLHCIHNSVTFSRWVVVLDQGSWEACELVFSSLTFMDILSIGALFFTWQMAVPLFAAGKCTWPQFSNKSLWFLTKNLFCTFPTFLNDKSLRFQAKSASPHTQLLHIWVSLVKRSASQWYPTILDYK